MNYWRYGDWNSIKFTFIFLFSMVLVAGLIDFTVSFIRIKKGLGIHKENSEIMYHFAEVIHSKLKK